MTERLQKILASRGICSRRQAEKLIAAGRVTVNGVTALLGQSCDPEIDVIALDGELIPVQGRYVYILLHKPRGFVTTLSDERGRRTVADLVDCGVRVYPVGRLDMDSEGLLILTNDGEFANHLTHPKAEIEKTYEVWVTHYVAGAEQQLLRPITLDGYTIRSPKIRLLAAEEDMAHLLITIHEGRNRQVRRMCQAAGMYVTRLRRISEGNISLGDLEKGSWRYLTDEEVAELKK